MPEEPKILPLQDRLNQVSTSFTKDVLEGNLNPATQYVGTKAPDYGESQFDKTASPVTVEEGNLADYRGLIQPKLDKIANAVPRLLSKVGTEILKTPGYLYALGESGLTDKTLAESLNNSWLNSLQHADDAVKEQFAIYKPKAVREGNLWDNLTSTSFWTDEGVDGVGYLAAFIFPGAALKATGLATKLAKLPGLAQIGIDNLELGQATLLNTALESAAETKGIVDNLNADFKNKIGIELNPDTGALWTAEEAKEAVGKAAVNTFQMNMGILLVPNMIMNKNLLGRFNTSKSVLDDLKDASGKFVVNSPTARKSAIKDYLTGIGEATTAEGFIEEAGQTTIENYNSKVALNKTNAGILEGLATEYINTLTSTEGQKAILLGSVLGAMGGSVGKYRERKQEAKDRSILTGLIKDNFEGFSVDMNNILQKDEQGKPVIDEITKTPKLNYEETGKVIANIVKEQHSTNLQDLAALNNDKDVYDFIYNQQLARFALPYLKQEGGLEILNQHIEDSSKLLTEVSKKFTNEVDFNESTFKAETKKTLTELQDTYKSIYSTVTDLGLDRLSDKPKLVEAFANKLAYTAYSETAKQIFLTNKLKELHHELLGRTSSTIADLPQVKQEIVKLQGRIDNISKSLEKSKTDYSSIFDTKEQDKAFADFANIAIKQEEAINKAKKDEEKTPTETKPVDTNEPTKVEDLIPETSKQNITSEDLDKARHEVNFHIMEALQTSSLAEFNVFKPFLDSSALLTIEEKAQIVEHEKTLKEAEGITDDINSNQDIVSDYINKNTVASSTVADEQIIVNPKEVLQGKFKDLVKGLSKQSSAVMMHLFNHYFDNGVFKFKRDKNGLPELDNNSNINIDSLNNIKEGDTITFRLTDLSPEAKKQFDISKKSSLDNIKEHIKVGNKYEYPTDTEHGFDAYHIGIYTDNQLIGFVQQPHAISDNIEGDVIDTYISSRNSIISQRESIINKLLKDEEVTSTITIKGSGNLYTKLTENGKIDPINHILDNIRDKDKTAGNAIFVVNTGDKLELPILEDSKETDNIEAKIAELGNWGKPGSVYQLVKATTNDWYPVPVYANLINDKTAKAIIDEISLFPENIDPIIVVRRLNPYIYASVNKGANITVKRELDITRLTINGETFTIPSIINTRKADFIKQLKTKRQNIEISNINSTTTQTSLKDRQTLITNATTFNGEYLVQPYLEFEDITSTEAKPKTKESINIEEVTQLSSTVEEVLKKRGITNDDISSEDAFSRTEFFNPDSTNKLEKAKLTTWLDKNLPGLSIYNTKEISELKTNIKDAVGMYRDMVIYLFNYSSNKTAYHEAFHGVFRNMMSYDDRMDLLNEVSKLKSLEPTQANLDFIQQAYTKKYSPEQLTFLYYEELLADMFADYTDKFEEKSLSTKILDFFKKILSFFNLYTKNNNNKLDDLFYKINTSKFKQTSLKAKQAIVNRPIKSFRTDNYVYKRIPGFNATFKSSRVKSIGDNFIFQYWSRVNTGTNPKDIKPSEIYNNIFSSYNDLIKQAATDLSISNDTIIDSVKIIKNNKELIAEANKYIGTFGIKINEKNIEYKEQEFTDESIDTEITTLNSKTTKGFNDWVSIPGLKSASTRLKMFLAGIPILDNGLIKRDKFGFPLYHNFLDLYYFLERNLTGLDSFDDMLTELDELSKIRPEIAIIKTKLLDGDGTITKEQLQLLQNDFKSNFDKQQLSYTLVKFDTDSNTGAVTFKIMDANRQSLAREINDNWTSNLTNPARNTISKEGEDGIINSYGTDKAKQLAKQWQQISKKAMSVDTVNNILLQVGIEFSPEVLKKVANDKVFISNVTTLLDWYSSDKPADKEKTGRKALAKLVEYEVTNILTNYTQSFNNVENKAIYTIQLPSFASKLLSKLTSKNSDRFNQAYNELTKDDSYKYSNLLKELKENLKFRQEGFKLNYLDGLKDERGNSEGAKFTSMSPKDFMYMQLALFDNNYANKADNIKEPTSKYVYITPADKTMSMVFDSKKYRVNLKGDTVELNSEILDKFYNVVLQEASRIKSQVALSNSNIGGDELLENYHYRKDTPPTRNEDGTWNIKWNGQAFKFNHFSSHFNKTLYQEVETLVSKDATSNVESDLESLKPTILNELLSELNNEVKQTILEAKDKQVIETDQKLAEFALNSWLFNIEASKLLNGDPAIYKDLAKRTYQSGSMTVSSNTTLHPKVRTIVVKDHIVDSLFTNDPEYKGINATDAQVYWTPEFYKDWHIMRGNWSTSMQLAYDIAEGNIKNPTKEQLEEARGKLVGVKPFYFGNRFDENLGIQRYEQVKTAVLPLFKSYIKDNPLLAEKLVDMRNIGVDMLAHESAFKAAIGYRDLITDDDFITLDLDTNNFGTQVDNPNHILDEANDSLRQLKMLLLGNIDPNKTYNGKSGEMLQFEINQIEGINIREDLTKLENLINNPTDTTFKNFIVEQLTKRGATENLQQVLEIVNGEFRFPPDLGPSSVGFENLISSIFTDKVVKQEFLGASAVQVTAFGFQKDIDKSTDLSKLQTTLKWVRPGEGDKIEYAEAYMPAWSKDYFDTNGHPKANIPDELKEILIYRIPTEGYHSMLPVKVIGFMPAELGNFILLPYEITKQFGADFDFDKIFFIAPEFHMDNDGNLFKVTYDEAKSAEDNSRKARNNKILDNYMKVVASKETYDLLTKPSGFDVLKALKEKIIGKGSKATNFYSSRTQRDLKSRNHIGLDLKGQSALHVSGHSYATMLGLNTESITNDGEISSENVFRFNGADTFNLSNLYNQKNELISDELSTMMAAILDDIKDPILEPLGINSNTIDIWASIVRAGYGAETGINLITQPAIRELSKKLQENTYQIKVVKQGWNSTKSLLLDYKTRLNAITSKLSEASLKELESEFDKLGKTDEKTGEQYGIAKNLNDSSMEFWRNWYNKNEDNLNATSDEEYNKMLTKYYIYQVRVLYNFGRYQQISKDLVKINRFFGINKEVGPNIENIIDKKYLLEEVQNAAFTIRGMENINNIDGLSAQYDTQISALNWFEKYFPYDSLQYNTIKKTVAEQQTRPSVTSILSYPAETRQLMNGFIRTAIDTKFTFFADINETKTKQYLFSKFPLQLAQIKDPANDSKYFNGKLRENIFIKQLQITFDKGIGYISLKGNRIDLQVKDSISEAIYSLWKNEDTKPIIVDLIKHSFASTGLFTGLNSFHSYISPDIWSEIGYDAYRKEAIHKLNTDEIILDFVERQGIIDQLIRNFPKKFTKVFDKEMFIEKDGKLYTNDLLIREAKRELDIIIVPESKEGPAIYVNYIRVYDNVAKRAVLYKHNGNNIYEYVTNLGKSGKMIEISTTEDIKKSIVKDNNILYKESDKKVDYIDAVNYKNDDEVSNDEVESPILEGGEYTTPTSQEEIDSWIEQSKKEDDIFGKVLPPSNEDINNLPKDIEGC